MARREGMKRPDKPKIAVVPIPPGLCFSDSVGRSDSVYQRMVVQALNAGQAVKIMANDAYMRHQLKKAAEKLKVKLVYAAAGEELYVKPIAIDGELKRLVLLIREPRTISEIQSAKLELHVENSLSGLAKDGLAHVKTIRGEQRWTLTEKGFGTL
jgi:hypothetical protein